MWNQKQQKYRSAEGENQLVMNDRVSPVILTGVSQSREPAILFAYSCS